MDEKRKAISADDRLRALALFVMAKEHVVKAREFELALHRLLMTDEGGHIGDLVWSDWEPPTVNRFDETLAHEGIAVVEGD